MNPVQSLQHILNHLARTLTNLPRLGESGTFDEATLEAVMIFQRDFGLPVTGIVDQVTWDVLTDAYYQNLFQFGPPPTLHVFPSGMGSVGKGEQMPEVLIVQAMLTALAQVLSNFEEIEFDSVNREATHQNLRLIQKLTELEESGILDRTTWAILAALYRTYITRRALSTFPL